MKEALAGRGDADQVTEIQMLAYMGQQFQRQLAQGHGWLRARGRRGCTCFRSFM
jgi:hypothetical protein